jgi:rSAM/selenodomain-associated transferase 1
VTLAGRLGHCAIAIMAKAPRQGEVKTRLVPPLSEADAAMLSGCFIRDIAGNILAAARAASIDGYVAYSPPGSADLFLPLLPERIGLLPPRRIGLAHSLFDAAEDLLAAGYGSVCLVNADSPTLPTSVLVAAARALAPPGDRLILGPAEDGGYYLIGLKHAHHRLFEEIDWSTERVFRQTLDRAAELGLDIVTLGGWYDVDDVASLRRLVDELGSPDPAGYAAPHTAAFLRLLALQL